MPELVESDSGAVDQADDMYCAEPCPSALLGFRVKLSLTEHGHAVYSQGAVVLD